MAIASWRITLSDSFHHPTVKDKVHALVQGIFLSICIISMRINFSVPFRAENDLFVSGHWNRAAGLAGCPPWVASQGQATADANRSDVVEPSRLLAM
jgi:hypothetical protein